MVPLMSTLNLTDGADLAVLRLMVKVCTIVCKNVAVKVRLLFFVCLSA